MADRISRSPLAEQDIADLSEYYRKEAGLTVALRFVASTEASIETLAGHPRMGATLGLAVESERNIRRWQIEGFPRLILLYQPTENGITVIRVIDAARDIENIFQDERP